MTGYLPFRRAEKLGRQAIHMPIGRPTERTVEVEQILL